MWHALRKLNDQLLCQGFIYNSANFSLCVRVVKRALRVAKSYREKYFWGQLQFCNSCIAPHENAATF